MGIVDADYYDRTSNPAMNMTEEALRERIVQCSKEFKRSWISLGQALYAVWKDKMYKSWGYDTFDAYTLKEVGVKKPVAMKLLRVYFFLEKEEPSYLKEDYADEQSAAKIPDYDALNVLRMAKDKKDIDVDDYKDLKKRVFEMGRPAGEVRKDLTSLMKQRKEVDPEEAREEKNEALIKRFLLAMKSFKRDAETLKLLPKSLLKETNDLMQKLETQVSRVSNVR